VCVCVCVCVNSTLQLVRFFGGQPAGQHRGPLDFFCDLVNARGPNDCAGALLHKLQFPTDNISLTEDAWCLCGVRGITPVCLLCAALLAFVQHWNYSTYVGLARTIHL